TSYQYRIHCIANSISSELIAVNLVAATAFPTAMAMTMTTPEAMAATAFLSGDALALVRWKHTRKGYDRDEQLLQAGLRLLSRDAISGRCDHLAAAEQAFNVPCQSIVVQALDFAAFLVTKAQKDTQQQQALTKGALRLLQRALDAADSDDGAVVLPLNACNQLLAAIADVVERYDDQDGDAADTLACVEQVFNFLFGLNGDAVATTPSFRLFKPPTNVYTTFLHRVLTVALPRGQLVLAEAALRVFHELQKAQLNKRKVFMAVAKTSLSDLVGYRHALDQLLEQEELEDDKKDHAKRIRALVDQIVVDALFDSEHLREFEGALVHTALWTRNASALSTGDLALNEPATNEHKKKRRKNDNTNGSSAALVAYPKHLFDELARVLADAATPDAIKGAVGGLLEVLVAAYATRLRAAALDKIEDVKTDVKTSKKRAATVIATTSTTFSPFKFWAELCAVALTAYHESPSKGALEVLVGVYRSLFRALCACDIYRVTEDTDERDQFQCMETVLATFVQLTSTQFQAQTKFQTLPKSKAKTKAISQDTERWTRATCEIVASAVQCSPNLANACLRPILRLLGAHAAVHAASEAQSVVRALGACVVDVVHAHDSMRLLDKLLLAMFAAAQLDEDNDDDTDERVPVAVAHGLYVVLCDVHCEHALRRAFRTLPPGQLNVLWTLLVEHLENSSLGVAATAMARLLLQTFLQELHVTPQNRNKISALVKTTHTQLFAPVQALLSAKSKKTPVFTEKQHELLCAFGELLVFYPDVGAQVRAETFDSVLEPLTRVLEPVVEQLLALKNASTTELPALVISSGIIKICVHWLRAQQQQQQQQQTSAARAAIVRRIVDYVVQWRCWDAVAFYLPELLGSQDVEDAEVERFLVALLADHFEFSAAQAATAKDNQDSNNAQTQDRAFVVNAGPAASRLVSDAAFYEIAAIQRVSASAITQHVWQCINSYAPQVGKGRKNGKESLEALLKSLSSDKAIEVPSNATEAAAMLTQRVRFVTALPAGFLVPGAGNTDAFYSSLALLLVLLQRLQKSKVVKDHRHVESLDALAAWLTQNLDAVAVVLRRQSVPALHQWARAVLDALLVDAQITHAPLLHQLLQFYCRDAAIEPSSKQCLDELLLSNATTSNFTASALVLNALAAIHRSHPALAVIKSEQQLVDGVLKRFEASGKAVFVDGDYAALDVFDALLQLGGAGHAVAASPLQQRLTACVSSHVGGALTAVLRQVVQPMPSLSAVRFFDNFCGRYRSLHPPLPLDAFGRMLAAALYCSGNAHVSSIAHSCDATAAKQRGNLEQALRHLVVHATRDEFRLLIATIEKELAASETARVRGALDALAVLLRGEKKLSATRRQVLAARKQALVLAFIQLLNRWQSASEVDWASCVATLQAFLWMLSYTLLLRIMRHHFASLVNSIPQIVQATNGLLELLVLASSSSKATSPSSSSVGAHVTLDWASNLARLYGYLKEHDAQLRKHVVYLLLEFLLAVTKADLALPLQHKLRPGVFALLDICSNFEKEQLYAALDTTGKSLLKTLDTSYKLTHRYVGKV
ncbi:TPA: hypothetical protein N0F65_008100, partial [Lagenidium giganteum]